VRYFVDERSGFIAVRDRNKTDPDYKGLYPDTEGVVRFWTGEQVQETCPTCGHKRFLGWTNSNDDLHSAQVLCDELNTAQVGGKEAK
jgi:hypothetical protein